MRDATADEVAGWDELVVGNPDGGHILQTRAWGEFKERFGGWRPRHLVHDGPGGRVATLALRRSVPGFGDIVYSPKGPGVVEPEVIDDMARGWPGLERAMVLKVEPELLEGTDLSSWTAAGFVKGTQDVQISRATIVVDIRRPEEELLGSFKPKCRYNIRLAQRRGVTVREVAVDDRTCAVMFELMTATQARAGFLLRQAAYFQGYWRLQHQRGQGAMFLAEAEGEVVAGAFVTYLGRKGWYKDGGSTRRHSELMAPHLLQWEAMRWLRARGVEAYDLVAVPRPAELAEGHPLYGLWRFKSGFSDHVTEFVGTWDLPLRRRRFDVWDRRVEPFAGRVLRRRGRALY